MDDSSSLLERWGHRVGTIRLRHPKQELTGIITRVQERTGLWESMGALLHSHPSMLILRCFVFFQEKDRRQRFADANDLNIRRNILTQEKDKAALSKYCRNRVQYRVQKHRKGHLSQFWKDLKGALRVQVKKRRPIFRSPEAKNSFASTWNSCLLMFAFVCSFRVFCNCWDIPSQTWLQRAICIQILLYRIFIAYLLFRARQAKDSDD